MMNASKPDNVSCASACNIPLVSAGSVLTVAPAFSCLTRSGTIEVTSIELRSLSTSSRASELFAIKAEAAPTAVVPNSLTAVVPALQASEAQHDRHDVAHDCTFASSLHTLEVKRDLLHTSVLSQSASDVHLSLMATHVCAPPKRGLSQRWL